MTFGGGPFGNYVLQAKATLAQRLRASPGSLGLIGSVGGYFAHFGYGLYSSDPGDQNEPAIEDVGAEFARLPRRPYLTEFDGSARVEAYTVAVDTTNEARACLTALTDRGERVWGRSADPDLTTALLADEEACGREARIRDGLLELV
jgi:acetyl-CoA C-acetyltransferase